MNRIIIATIICVCIMSELTAQHFIGCNKAEIEQKMKETRKYYVDNSVVNKAFNYLKYVDLRGNRTYMLFLDESDKCKSTKLMCDYLEKDDVTEELDEDYKKVKDNVWEYEESGIIYQVRLIEEKWFFSVITKPKTAFKD